MSITLDEVRRIAELAHLELEDPVLETYREQLESILEYVALIDDLDVDGIPATAHVLESYPDPLPDDPRPSLDADEALVSGPDTGDGHFRVPKVLPR